MTKPVNGRCRTYDDDTKTAYHEKPCEHTIDPSKSYCLPDKGAACPITKISFEKKDIMDEETGDLI